MSFNDWMQKKLQDDGQRLENSNGSQWIRKSTNESTKKIQFRISYVVCLLE